MKPVVFLGPTVDLASAAEQIDADFKPPAQQGDVLRAALAGAPAIGIIDGYFERVPSIWHKEILFALSEGISVYGASSMGALRASELHSFGMAGVGKIFEDYRDGRIEDDDEVAIVHAPAEVGYQALSEAMVNIRATILKAVKAEVISESDASRLLELAKARHYKERSYPALIDDARTNGLDPGLMTRFEAWLADEKVDLKKNDALEMLAMMNEDQRENFIARKVEPFVVEESLSWQKAREFANNLNRRDVPQWHFSMLGDEARIAAFERAIIAAVKPGDVVLDIGTGSGLLAMMAAKAGASHVYACESVAVIARKAREIISANALSDRITVLDKRSTDLVVDVDIPERADVLVSEIVDRVLIGEGIIPTLEHALTELVKPDAKIIPQSGRLLISAIECEELYARNTVSSATGFDISLFNEFSLCGGSALMQLNGLELKRLSEPTEAINFSFSSPDFAVEEKTVALKTTKPGTLHGVVMWFELVIDGENAIDNTPWRPDNHWSHEVYLLEKPRQIESGDQIGVWVQHDKNTVRIGLAKD